MADKADRRSAPHRRGKRDDIPETPDPVDIAMAAVASGRPLPDIARRVLEEQADLLHAQRVELKMRHVGEVVRAALWAILAVVALVLLALLVSLIVRASRSDALIVESFRVPPTLAARGLGGEVVATQVLDRLAEMEKQSDSIRTAKTYGNNWGDELKIDIPSTSATADQLWRLLRGWLGEETRISGEVTQTPEGLVLTTRVGANPGSRFVSKTGNMSELTRQGAEHIYRSTQTYRYAVYVSRDPERQDEWRSALEQLAADPSVNERKWAFNGLNRLADGQGDFRRAEYYARKALAIDPDMYVGHTNLAFALWAQGRDQEAVDAFRRIEEITISDEYDASLVAPNRCADRAQLAFMAMDVPLLQDSGVCMHRSTKSGYPNFGLFTLAAAGILRHDPQLARSVRPSHFTGLPRAESEAFASELNLRAAMQAGPTPALATAYERFVVGASARAAAGPAAGAYVAVLDRPLQADALSMMGRFAEAQALIGKTARNCYSCLRVHGLVAQRMGDAGAAQGWFVAAAEQGPRLAPAFLDWGKLLLEHRRYGSAEAKLRRAAELAPGWADPLKYWGDLLAAQRKRKEALAKYDAALKLAPNWAELQQARARLART